MMIQPQIDFCCFRLVAINIALTHCYKLVSFLNLSFAVFLGSAIYTKRYTIKHIFGCGFEGSRGLTRVCHQQLSIALNLQPLSEKNSHWIFTFCVDPTGQLRESDK